MKYSARDFSVCMDKALWQSIRIVANAGGGDGDAYYRHTIRSCRKLSAKLGIPWKEVMDALPANISGYRNALLNGLKPDLWEKVAHPHLLVDDIMDL